jgi:hypothetical protein
MKFNEKQMMGRFGNTSTIPPRKIIYKEGRTNRIPRLTDKVGLDKAYDSPDKLHVQGDTLYVAGTSNLRDYWDDLKIPFGKTANAQRYIDADKLLEKNPQVSNLVGHSLGGSAVLELQKNLQNRKFKTNVYGTPAASLTTPDNVDNHRYRNFGDPFSIFDRGAEINYKPSTAIHYGLAYKDKNPVEFWNGVLDSHTYKNFDSNKVAADAIQTDDNFD